MFRVPESGFERADLRATKPVAQDGILPMRDPNMTYYFRLQQAHRPVLMSAIKVGTRRQASGIG
jgi:hypothetical protein